MAEHPIPTPPAGSRWRIVMLDRDVSDPKWIIATVLAPSDVRPAELDQAGRYTGWETITAWVATAAGHPVTLHPVHDALAWRLDDRRPKP